MEENSGIGIEDNRYPRLRLAYLNLAKAQLEGSKVELPILPLNQAEKDFLIDTCMLTEQKIFTKKLKQIIQSMDIDECKQIANIVFHGSLNKFDLSKPIGKHLIYKRTSYSLTDNSTTIRQKNNTERTTKLKRAFLCFHKTMTKFILSEKKEEFIKTKQRLQAENTKIVPESTLNISKLEDKLEILSQEQNSNETHVEAVKFLKRYNCFRDETDPNLQKMAIVLVGHYIEENADEKIKHFIKKKYCSNKKHNSPEALITEFGPELYLDLIYELDDLEFALQEKYPSLALKTLNNDIYFAKVSHCQEIIENKAKKERKEASINMLKILLNGYDKQFKGIAKFGELYFENINHKKGHNLKAIYGDKYNSYMDVLNKLQKQFHSLTHENMASNFTESKPIPQEPKIVKNVPLKKKLELKQKSRKG